MRPMKKKKLMSRNSLVVIYSSATKVTSNTRTRKEHLFAEETIYYINYVIQRFPALTKVVRTHVKKYDLFFT